MPLTRELNKIRREYLKRGFSHSRADYIARATVFGEIEPRLEQKRRRKRRG